MTNNVGILNHGGTSWRQSDGRNIFKISAEELKNLFNCEKSVETRFAEMNKDHNNIDGLLEKLQTNSSSGIMGDDRDLKRRTINFNENKKPTPHMPELSESIKEAFQDYILLIVAICAALSMITGMIYEPKTGWVEGTSIFIVLGIMITITSLNDWFKDKQFVDLLSRTKDEKVPVFRGKNGQMQTIDMWSLVVGDVITLSVGDVVPADCIIIKSDTFSVVEPIKEESTHEARPKGVLNPFLLADSEVMTGNCLCVVACVGINSTRIKEEKKLDTLETALQQKLFTLTKTFTFIGLISASVILITAIIIQCIQTGVNDEVGGKIFMKKLFQNITLCMVILLVAIPEGLPMSVSISLAHSTTRMYKYENILIRKLDAPERMGQITEICCGLSGTLTSGDMTVNKFYAESKMIQNSRKDTIMHCEMKEETLLLLRESMLYNNSCHMEINENSFYVPKGNDTEIAFLRWLQDAEVDVHGHMNGRQAVEVNRIALNSYTKRSIVAIKHPEMDDTIRIYVKGAPEVILGKCTSTFNQHGEKIELDKDCRTDIKKQMTEEMTKQGFRTLGFSYKDMSVEDFYAIDGVEKEIESKEVEEALCADQTFIALIALKDPLRDHVKKAINRAKRARITTRIITNNSLQTTIAQAIDAGLLDAGLDQDSENNFEGQAMLGSELTAACGGLKQEYNDDMTSQWKVVDQNAFEQKVENLVILARATPEDKLLMIAGLKAMDKRVAIIGDSNNDIKSFGSAHVSICMGSGSAIAKQQADMVLLDDDFYDAINAVMYGRNIFTNIKRFLMFQVTANFSVIITIFISFIYLTESPISSTQLLWINLIIDTFAALALATMPPMNSVLREPANDANHSILEKCQWRQIYGVTVWNTIVMCIIIFGGKALFDLEYTNATQMTEHGDNGKLTQGAIDKRTHFTIIFNVFVQLIWFNEWNCRVVNPQEKNVFKKLFSSWTFLIVMTGTAAMQWSSCKWLAWLFECEVLTPTLFCRCLAYGFTVIPFAFLLKLTPISWVDRIPVGISEHSAMGKNSFIMKGYDAANSKRKISIVKKDTKTANDLNEEGDDPEVSAVIDEKDDEYKQA